MPEWLPKILRRLRRSSTKATRTEPSRAPVGDKAIVTVAADHPIERAAQDTLGRVPAAVSFARQVLTLDATQGVVVGVLGPWGSGKTSFINLAREEFDRASTPLLDFNPWMFSGTEQLVESFFTELAAQLRVRENLAGIARNLEEYGEAFSRLGWIPVVGPWIARGGSTSRLLSKMLERRREGIGKRRATLEASLAALGRPVVVVIDDIDRLSTPEIRDVFKLVRLTASFPNVVYLLAFDRLRVETALSDQGILGRDYLEKILQVAFDLPPVPPRVLLRQVAVSLDEALSGIENPGPFDGHTWPDLLAEVVHPLVRNMRDVRRYAAGVRNTVITLDGQIALADVLALEAVRTFLPEVHSRLHGAVEALTETSSFVHGAAPEPPELKATIESLVASAGPRGEVVRSMIRRLFPAAERHIGGSHYGPEWKVQWLRERRIGHEELIRLYLERVPSEGLSAFLDAERAFRLMADRAAFDATLRSLDRERWEDVISSLETFENEFAPEHVVPGCIALLNLLPDIPERPRSMFEYEAQMVVGRVTYRLLRSLGNPERVESAVKAILPEVVALSSKLALISEVGHREGVGHKLVTEGAAAEFERGWRGDVRANLLGGLGREWNLLRVLYVARRDTAPDEPPPEIPDEPAVTLALLRGARTEVRSQALESRLVRRSPRLQWDALIEVFGSEDGLRRRVERLRDSNLDGEDELVTLVDKYLGGWRPSNDDRLELQ